MRNMLREFPHDENGEALRRMQENGDDLTKPRDIDFTVILPDQRSAEAFTNKVRLLGYKASAEETGTDPELPWDVVVVNHLVPSHENISDFEKTLEMAALPFGGRNDGCGCVEQPVRH